MDDAFPPERVRLMAKKCRVRFAVALIIGSSRVCYHYLGGHYPLDGNTRPRIPHLCRLAAAGFCLLIARQATASDRLAVELIAAHGPQKPAAVPTLPGLFAGKQWIYGPLVGRPKPGEGYQPSDGDSFAFATGRESTTSF